MTQLLTRLKTLKDVGIAEQQKAGNWIGMIA